MIIEWAGDYVGSVGFNAVAEDYDGEPRISRYWFDASPKTIHPDREALAAFLVYGSYFGGHVRMPHKFSPAVEFALRTSLSPVPVAFSPVEYYPKALPNGSKRMYLSWAGSAPSTFTGLSAENSSYLRVERSDESAGSMRAIKGLTVASNAWLHSALEKVPERKMYSYVAAAVLFAEDLEADTIVLPSDFDIDALAWPDLQLMLASVRLGLQRNRA